MEVLEQSATEKLYFKSLLYMRSCSNSKTNIVKDTHCYDKAAHDQIQTSSENVANVFWPCRLQQLRVVHRKTSNLQSRDATAGRFPYPQTYTGANHTDAKHWQTATTHAMPFNRRAGSCEREVVAVFRSEAGILAIWRVRRPAFS